MQRDRNSVDLVKVDSLLEAKAGAAALLHFISKISHGFRRNWQAFSTRQRSFGHQGSPRFQLACIFGTAEPTGLNGLADECFLIRA
jgi:hypothetical protein